MPVPPSFEGRLGSTVPNPVGLRDPVMCYSPALPVVFRPILPIPNVVGLPREESVQQECGAIRTHARAVHRDRSLKIGGSQGRRKQDDHLFGDGRVLRHRQNLLENGNSPEGQQSQVVLKWI